MDLLARLRPGWRHPDPAVRLAAVRDMKPDDRERLATIATGDADVRVRRAAIERLDDPELLARIATADADHALRELAGERAREALVRIACSDATVGDCEAALARTTDAHGLAAIAVGAAHERVRQAALARVAGDRILRAVVRNAADPAIRRDALDRIQDDAILRSVVLGDGPRELAARALERLRDADALRAIASSRTVAKTLRERARELLAAHTGAPSVLGAREARARQLELCTTVHMLRSRHDVLEAAQRVRDAQREWDELARAAEPRADVAAQFAAACEAVLRDATSLARRQAELDHARDTLEQGLAVRTALCARVEALEGPDLDREVTEARRTWPSLEPLAGEQAAAVQRRFARACEDALTGHRARSSAETQRASLEQLVAEAEGLGSALQPPAATAWQALAERWQARARTGDAAEVLSRRFAAAQEKVQQRLQEAEEQRAALEQKNLRRLEALCAQATEM